MESYSLQKLGVHKTGLPRFYKQGKRLGLAGFQPRTRYDAHVLRDRGLIMLKLSAQGSRVVSHKLSDNDEDVPVIDITSRDVLSVFAGMDQIRVIVRAGVIYLMALATEVRRQDRVERLLAKIATQRPLDVGSLSHGAGILSEALKDGMREVGVEGVLCIANDIEPDYLAHAQTIDGQWNDLTIELAAPLQEVAFDEWMTSRLPKLDVLSAGLPCTAASLAGRAKKSLSLPEQDPNVGHLVVAFLQIILRTNPSVVVLENVPQWETTASMCILRNSLVDWGYEVHTRVLSGGEFGALEDRKRLCVVAVSRGIEFDFEKIEVPTFEKQCVGDILEPVPDDDPSWSPLTYLREKEVRDIAAGKGFKMQTLGPEDTSVGTIGRGYNRRRSTEPFLRHPTQEGLLRLFTPVEHARAKGVDPRIVKGLGPTRAHEVLGQGICYAPFVAVGKLIGIALSGFRDRKDMPAASSTEQTAQLSLAAT
ncbi:DNA cytosine methyltransferase [Ottowia sp.]|uniref:DNA cytosine methyltransferase n=1 Tax=Ottowia sp. TaxID=1898956 RepID=UPI0025D381D4|nr:DNA cytosine methyltransferase [Ottowia sp.]MBK6616199.1 DNA cytosine methyltransferase [Ottowia sp.]